MASIITLNIRRENEFGRYIFGLVLTSIRLVQPGFQAAAIPQDNDAMMALRAALFGSKHSIQARCTQLLEAVRAPLSFSDEYVLSVAKDIWSQISTLPQAVRTSTGFDEAILSQISVAAGQSSNETRQITQEHCEICDSVVPLVSLTWAKCDNGHQFSEFSIYLSSRYVVAYGL
jgi:hypothetical protein